MNAVQCESGSACSDPTFKQLHGVTCARVMSPVQKKRNRKVGEKAQL